MSSEWLASTLGEFVRFQRGHDLTADSQKAGVVPVMGSAGQNGTHNEAKAHGPGVVIGRSGASIGRIHWSKVDFWPHNTCLYVTDFLGNNPRFVYYLLQTLDLAAYNSGSAQPSLNRNYIYSIKVRVPGRSEQDAIAELLEAFDDRITLLRETNATLDAFAQALFKSWFVDFDPVRAKLDGRVPEGMDEATAALFPDSFEESELGLVPRGWRVGTLFDLAMMNPESWSSKTQPTTIQYIDLANAKNNEIDEIALYQFDEAPSRARRVLRVGDTIIGTVRPSNRSFAHIYQSEDNLTGSTGFAVLRPRDVKSTEFVYMASTQNSSIDHLAHVADGGAYPAVRPEVVANIQTVLPCDDIIDSFHKIASVIFSRVGAGKTHATSLVMIRDTLLPRLISGQLRLPEAEALLDEVAA